MRPTMYTGLFSCFVALAVGSAQDSQHMKYAPADTSNFMSMPGVPSCMTLSVQDGDPARTAVVVLAKFTAGCSVPWHWHTANERLMIVSGTGKADMKGESGSVSLKPGDFIYMPAKGVHQFTAVTDVQLFLTSDGPFDIHYVDASGNEIPSETALKSNSPAANSP